MWGLLLLAGSVGGIRVSALVRFPTDSCGTLRYTFLPSPTAALRQASVAERPVALPPEIGERPMPIAEFLDGHNPDPETKRVMGIAFEMARVALRLAGRGDLANEIIARRIIELARAGERDPDLLCEGVLKQFREQRL